MAALHPPCARCLLAARRSFFLQRRAASTSTSTASPQSTSSSPSSSPAPSSPSLPSSSSSQVFHTAHGRVKVDLSKPSLVGVHQSRGERPYQEDSFSIHALTLDPREIDRSLHGIQGYPEKEIGKGKGKGKQVQGEEGREETRSELEETEPGEQTVYAAVFDGHNGSFVSSFLKSNLHTRMLGAEQASVASVVDKYRSLGGYLRRYKGGILEGLVNEPARRGARRPSEAEVKEKEIKMSEPWNLHQRIHASFLQADLQIMEKEKECVLQDFLSFAIRLEFVPDGQ